MELRVRVQLAMSPGGGDLVGRALLQHMGEQGRSCWVPTAVLLLWVCQHSPCSQPGPPLQEGDDANFSESRI